MTLPIHHPLDPLTVDEIKKAATFVRDSRQGQTFIFNSISLKEPRKKAVLDYEESQTKERIDLEREVLIITIDRPSGKVHEVIVSLTEGKIKSTTYVPNVQPTLHPQEMLEAEQAMLKDERIIEECRKCGITDMSTVFADPWAVGFVEEEDLKPRRLMQALVYMRTCEDDNQYAHPLDFLPLIGKYDSLHCKDVGWSRKGFNVLSSRCEHVASSQDQLLQISKQVVRPSNRPFT
jgi:primary-amine oxidase